MAITTMDGLLNALGVGQKQQLMIPSATNVAGGWINLNQLVTSSFGIQATPTAFGSGGTQYKQSTQTAGFPRWANNSSNSCYIGKLDATFATAGTIHVYDLLWAGSGFSGAVATAQAVATFAGMPVRNANGTSAELWVGCSSIIGATAHNVTVSYTNQAGVAAHTTQSQAGIASMPVGRLNPLILQSGDTGVSNVASMTLSISSGTAGNLWLLLMQRICSVSAAVVNQTNTLDAFALSFPQINDEACLLFVHQATATSSGVIMGTLTIAQG